MRMKLISRRNKDSSPSIFNHDLRFVLTLPLRGGSFYSGRPLGLSEPEDFIQIHPDLRSLWPAVTEHYRRIGLSHSVNPIWNVSLEECRRFSLHDISLVMYADIRAPENGEFDWIEEKLPQLVKTVKWINSKNNFIHLARRMGLPVPDTETCENKTGLSFEGIGYPCFFKPSISCSGLGIVRCENQQQLEETLETFPDEEPFQVQETIDSNCFINLQYRATGGEVSKIAATREILNGYMHYGSSFPVDEPPWEVTDPMADHLASEGLRGIFAFDVARLRGAGARYQVLECNPRFNGASYPSLIAEKMGIPSWFSEIFTTKKSDLAAIDIAGIEFDPSSGTGIILINWGMILAGKIEIMFAGNQKQQADLRREFIKRI